MIRPSWKRLEDVFKKAFLLNEPCHDLLDLARLDAIEAGDKLFEETGFHAAKDEG